MKTISRRNFIRSSAMAAGSAILAPTLLSSCAKGANDHIMIGHIGVGSMGSAALKHWFMPIKGGLNIAAADPFTDRRETAAKYMAAKYKENGISAPATKAYHHFKEMLERTDIDAVNITTPDHWHVPIAIEAARAGKHIYLAKPLGLSYDNFLLLEKEVKKAGVVFQYGTQQRASSHLKLANRLILEGQIGDIERVEVVAPGAGGHNPVCKEEPIPEGFDYDLWTGPAKLKPYCAERVKNTGAWYQYNYSIGFLAGWGAHPLDIMIWAMKDKMNGAYTCEGTGKIWPDSGMYNTVCSWDLNYVYESGMKLRFMSSDVANAQNVLHYRKVKEGNATTFFGEKGWISVGRNTAESNIPDIQKQFDAFPRNKNNKAYIQSDAYRTGQEFVDTIKGEIQLVSPLDQAILSDCISHAGDMAIRSGRKIKWNPKQGGVVNDPQAMALFHRNLRAPYTV